MASFLPFSTKDAGAGGPGDSAGADGGAGQEDEVTGWFTDASDDPCLPALTRYQRLMLFMAFLVFGVVCFGLAFLYLPVLYLKARKFALLFSLGSLMVLGSMSMLHGPKEYLLKMFTRERAVFSLAYLGSILATLYAAMSVRSTLLTILFASIQIMVLFTSLVSYVPGGTTGLRMLFKVWLKMMTKIVVPAATACIPKVFNL